MADWRALREEIGRDPHGFCARRLDETVERIVATRARRFRTLVRVEGVRSCRGRHTALVTVPGWAPSLQFWTQVPAGVVAAYMRQGTFRTHATADLSACTSEGLCLADWEVGTDPQRKESDP